MGVLALVKQVLTGVRMPPNARTTAFQEYVVQTNVAHVRLLENKENIPWSNYVGAAGMPGEFRSVFK